MARLREGVYRPPAVKTWTVEDKDGKARVIVTRYDNGKMKVWVPELGIPSEGIEIRQEHLDDFVQAVAAAHIWTDQPPGTTEA